MAALERDARELALTHPERSAPAGHQKLTFALPVDGIGDLKPPSIPQLLITTDNVPDAPDTAGNTNPTIAVTGPGTTTPVVSTIDTLGDQDFYKVTLSAGTAYEFGLYSYAGGPNAVGLIDPYLELYGADGSTLVVSADGGADTVYNQVNSGFDVLLVYTPAASGTYYINARAFSNSPATTTGDSVGDYQLFAREQDPNDPSIYRPYYDPTEPLYAIDWGTQVNKINQTARNPDGNEGTRDTGNAQGMPTFGSGLDVPALAGAQGVDITGKNVITIYFAQAGDIFVSNDPTNPGLPPATITAVAVQGFERTAVLTSLAEFAKVADVVYLEVDNRDDADFIYTSYQGTPGPGISLLGSMSPPGESDEGLAQFNSGDERWNASDLAQGGFSFVTLIHEFGHGHGLAHPHDNGGRSGIMNGVEQETPTSVADYTTGEHDLNQGVFTMMSYEDGWQTSPYGNAETDAGYGYLGGLMAFDIAAIQDKYGVNEQWATGNDTYTLKDVNTAGTYYSSIWDGGGTDAIVYAGSRDTTIDLRAATLAYEPGGGGRVSFANGIFGGFTIANGVTIENAAGGDGDDTLTGNGAGNILNGGGGGDTLRGGLGDDTLIGGAGFDVAVFDDTAGSRSMWIFIDKVEVEGLDGTDTLFGIERMVFSDETYDLVRGFSPPLLAAGGFGAEAAAGGWSSNATTPRMLVDVTGDGALDVVGFGTGGVHVAAGAGNGGDPNGSVTGAFGAPFLASSWFGTASAAGGWASDDTHPRTLADVNGDGAADLVGFGADGVHVALNIGGGTFAAPVVGIYGFGSSVASGGWTDNDTAPRLLADLNDDGRADILGFAESGTYVALASSDGTFGAPYLATFGYGSSAAAGGWTSDSTTPRRLADLNGDGFADLVGFAAAGVYASLGDGGGGFNVPFLATNGFGSSAGSGGWTDIDARPRLLADLNGDGRDDILGFGADGTYGALANADGTFAAPYLAHGGFGSSAGSGSWASDNTTPRLLADLNGDGSPDLVGFGPDGVYAAYGDGSGSFGAPFLANAGFGSSAASGGWTNQDSDPRFVVDLDGGGIADIVGFGDIGVITAIGVSDWVLV